MQWTLCRHGLDVPRLRDAWVCLVGLVLVAASAGAQMPTAVIEGTVTDTTGAAIVGAQVAARDVDTNLTRTLLTEGDGSFRLAPLPVGTYDIRVMYAGFSDHEQRGIVLTIGQTVHLMIALVPAGVVETVGVTAQPPPLDTRQTAVATTIDNERIEELPVQSRNYLNFVLLAPGVVPSQSGTASGTASALPDSGFSFAGLRPRSNLLTIDGLDNNDHYSGASRTELSLEIVREFQVVTNGWSAENGGASGGAINVVTKSGTNTIHGDAFIFGEPGRLDAPPPLEETGGIKPALTRLRGGFSLGGPIVKNRTFFYSAVEREQTHGQAASNIDPQTVFTMNSVLPQGAFTGFGTRRLTAGLFPIATTETEWSAKVNHQITARHSVLARVAGTTRDESSDAFNTGGLTDVSARGTSGTRDKGVTATWTSILGSRMTNEVRGQFATRYIDLNTMDRQGPGVLISGAVDFGKPYAGNDAHDQTYAEIGDTVAWSRGTQFVKAGFDVTHVGLSGSMTDGMGGLYEFRALGAFQSGRPDAFRQVFGGSAINVSTNEMGVFVQDHWTPYSRLTIDAGVRLDAETLPPSLGITNRQVSPRFGIAWTPASAWVIRGGAGIFADRLVLAAFERALIVDGHHGFEQVVDGPAAADVFNGSHGGALSTPLSGIAPSIYTVQPGMWHPSSRQASIGVERQLTSNLTSSVNYLFVRGHDLTRTVNVNLPPPTVLTLANASSLGVDAPVPQQVGRPVFGPTRINPPFDGIFESQPTASSIYHGLIVTLNRRLADDIEWSAAYTWSHATDTASDFDEHPQNPYALNDESADSRYDERHRFVASALFDLPIGEEEEGHPTNATPNVWVSVFRNVEAAPIVTIGSGHPVNPLTGVDDNRSHAFPLSSRPLGSDRNSLRLPASATLDLRVLKFFNIKRPHGKLDLVVEAFNLLSRLNATQLNSTYGPLTTPLPTFGRPVDASAARRVQFSVDFEF